QLKKNDMKFKFRQLKIATTNQIENEKLFVRSRRNT
ncbi:MAG: hypothetical protein ACI8RD_011344, partial [Bacillariaceae sp.]